MTINQGKGNISNLVKRKSSDDPKKMMISVLAQLVGTYW